MHETSPIREEAAAANDPPASSLAINVPVTARPIREPSPLRPLLTWLGLTLAIANLCLFPCFIAMLRVALSVAFSGRSTTPQAAWLPLLIFLTVLLAGLVPAQAFLAAVCFTWSQGDYWRRLLQHWLVVLASASTLLVGGLLVAIWVVVTRSPHAIGPWYGSNNQVVQTFLGILAGLASLPIVLLAVQLPFWFARHFYGCRLVQGTDSAALISPRPRESLALRDLFVATALIAISLGLLQFSDGLNSQHGLSEKAYLFGMLIFATSCLVVTCIVALPLTVLFFRCRSLRFAWGVALAAAGICAVVALAITQSNNPSPEIWEVLLFYTGLFYSFTCASAAGLTILRRDGWRMVSRWSAGHG